MSAFLLLATTPNYSGDAKRKVASHNYLGRPQMTQRPRNSSVTHINATSSINSKGARKKIFDPATFQYVEVEDMQSVYEQKLMDYEQSVSVFQLHDPFSKANTALNNYKNSQNPKVPLLSVESVYRLQYCYFEEFGPEKPIDTSSSTYSPLWSPNDDKEIQATSCIRTILCQDTFWNDVYQDIKYDLDITNFYEWLPPRNVAQKFMVDLVDASLNHLHHVGCDVSDSDALSVDEIDDLRTHRYFYYPAQGAAALGALKQDLLGNFITQMNPNISSNEIISLLKVVISSIGDNLRIQYYGNHEAEPILQFFGDFLVAIVHVMWMAPSSLRRRMLSMPTLKTHTSSLFDTIASTRAHGPPAKGPAMAVQVEASPKKARFFRRLFK